MSKERERTIHFSELLDKEIPFIVDIDIPDRGDYENCICLPGIMILLIENNINVYKVTPGKHDESLEIYYTEHGAIDGVIKTMKGMNKYKYRFELCELKEENKRMKEGIKQAIKNQKERINILAKQFLGEDEQEQNYVEDSIDQLLKLQEQCGKLMDYAIDYHPDSDKVMDLEKEFKNKASTQG
jgi:hypothetical protein